MRHTRRAVEQDASRCNGATKPYRRPPRIPPGRGAQAADEHRHFLVTLRTRRVRWQSLLIKHVADDPEDGRKDQSHDDASGKGADADRAERGQSTQAQA